jgi:uncharacterized protein YqeY
MFSSQELQHLIVVINRFQPEDMEEATIAVRLKDKIHEINAKQSSQQAEAMKAALLKQLQAEKGDDAPEEPEEGVDPED